MQALRQHSRGVQARPAARAGLSRRRVALVQAKKTADGPSIAIVGVTGAVGQEFLTVSSLHAGGGGMRARPGLIHAAGSQVLKERNFPYSSLKLLASAR